MTLKLREMTGWRVPYHGLMAQVKNLFCHKCILTFPANDNGADSPVQHSVCGQILTLYDLKKAPDDSGWLVPFTCECLCKHQSAHECDKNPRVNTILRQNVYHALHHSRMLTNKRIPTNPLSTFT